MDITFYNYTGEKNRLNKDLSTSENVVISNCAFNTEYNIINPRVKIAGAVDMTAYNYCFANNLYYFVDSIEIHRNGFYILKMSLDVLMTYKDLILQQYGTIRQSKTALYLNGNNIPVSGHTKIKTYEFENNFNENGVYVLLSNGAKFNEN